ncbi:MFS general substrate transporter [Hortaea werneckii]|nr:MFS general substrate transporter [Hortaea werneckii]KAI7496485.1 MFS general substrate transporter [Hortaea werneckii]
MASEEKKDGAPLRDNSPQESKEEIENHRDNSTSSSERARDLEKGVEDGVGNSKENRRKSSVPEKYTEDGKRIITEIEAWDHLGYSWPSWKKWMLLSSIFAVQVSMNFNTSVFPNAVPLIAEEYGVSKQAARVGQMIFLVAYAFGCELWAPWSEEFGRWPILQVSLFLVNIWQILAALAPNFGSLVVARFLGGLCSAGGSVTIGMVADLFQPEEQQWGIAFVVLSSVAGTTVGPIVGGPIEKYLPLQWNFWIQLIFGAVVQAIHFFMPESRSTILMDKRAKHLRKTGEDTNVYGPDEVKKPRISGHEVMITWIRPFEMFVKEPIVLSLSLLSGFSDALIFTFQEGFNPVYKQWGFGPNGVALAFLPILIGYILAYVSYFPFIIKDKRIIAQKGPDALPPEHRLYWLLYLAPLETIGLFGFAWTSLGPEYGIPWIAPMIFSSCIAIANYAIYMSTIDYMVASYGVYSASASGGNGFARDFLAGIAALYATPLYENVGPQKYNLEYASTILACLAFVVTIPIYIFYWKGEWFREKSKFAQSLDADRKETRNRRLSSAKPEQLEPGNW